MFIISSTKESSWPQPLSKYQTLCNAIVRHNSETIKESLNVNKSLHDEGFYAWYTLALNVFQEFDLDAEDFSNMDKCFHKIKSNRESPNSDNVEMLHAVFLRPKIVLQYFVCIFSYDDFSCRAKVSQNQKGNTRIV
jgi:hypothetical protein